MTKQLQKQLKHMNDADKRRLKLVGVDINVHDLTEVKYVEKCKCDSVELVLSGRALS